MQLGDPLLHILVVQVDLAKLWLAWVLQYVFAERDERLEACLSDARVRVLIIQGGHCLDRMLQLLHWSKLRLGLDCYCFAPRPRELLSKALLLVAPQLL